ncbi:MAG: MFS transporter [candidate division Zixibacteria bacterium]|nr:MFS transporter [candidate division Zixibacteria bacterium]MDH3938561.1 MFS transporter [candidate division Zixibacteria bacterium]MDH4035436.1 MFS transporter [candidate division Zixibacteria bacterium]
MCYLLKPMNWRIKNVSIVSITLSASVVWIGFYAWRVMFNNFAVDLFDASATDVGVIQAVREIPGLLAFGVGALAVYFTESRIASLSIIVVGLGLLVSGWAPSLVGLGIATVLMSFGFHYFEPTNSAQLLNLTDSAQLGKAQGKLRSWESAAGLVGAGLVMLLTLYLDYRTTFYIFGALVVLVGLYFCIALPANRTKQDHRKVKLKKKYWLYYTLSFLRGCRRHIFTTFAIFLLVKNHGLDITYISGIMLANNLVTIFTNRWMGTVSDRVGERNLLVGCSLILTFIFFGYAIVDYLPALVGLYLVDNVLFGSSIALKSYLRKISTPEDLTSCLSFGMTANHVTAVVIPVVGGIAWSMFGHEVTFIAGAVIVFVDMLFALKIPKNNNC